MNFFKQTFVALFCLFSIINTATAQSGHPISVYATGGFKTSNFEQVQRSVSAFNLSAGYDESRIDPKIDNTISFFAGMYAAKPLSKRFTVSNELVLDMQQLDITSGFQRQGAVSGITSYTTISNTDLLARLKLAFGLHYNLVARKDNRLSFGLLAGQMIALSGKTNSYSLLGATLRLERKQHAVFISGTTTPYDTEIKNLENYVGNINAELVIARYAYRIHEINIGYAIRL